MFTSLKVCFCGKSSALFYCLTNSADEHLRKASNNIICHLLHCFVYFVKDPYLGFNWCQRRQIVLIALLFALQVIEKQHRMMEQLGSQIQVFIPSQWISISVPNVLLYGLLAAVHHQLFVFFFKALEEQVSQEESSSQALREEVLAKEQNVLELRTAMKEVRLNPALQIHSCFFASPQKKKNQN